MPIPYRISRLVVLALAGALLMAAVACGGGDSKPLVTPEGGDATPVAAPEFPGGFTWFNVTQPLTLEELRGKVVLLDFWTLGCINCQHVVPDLKRLETEFGDALVVIGVHSGKYDREHDDNSIREAVLRLGLEHPVVNDPDFVIWNAYQVSAWPTQVLIDPGGNIVGGHEGEGAYDATDAAIKDLVAEYDGKGALDRTPIAINVEAPPISSAFLSFPGTVLADEAGGHLFIADSGHNRVLVSSLSGELISAIGSGKVGSDDGATTEASFNQPQGLALSAEGKTLYVADTRNHLVRAVDLEAGEVTTIAGTGERLSTFKSEPVPAREAPLASPWGLQLIGTTLFVAMAGSHQIWTIDLGAKTASVFAGSSGEGIDDGPLLSATLAQPSGITTNGSSIIWVDPESSSVRTTPADGSGIVRTIVGQGLFAFGDVDGSADVARLEHAQGIAYHNDTIYVADTYNHKIRTVSPATGEVQTVAGNGEPGNADGGGAAAAFDEPGGLSTGANTLYIADTNNNAIRTLDFATGEVRTLTLSNLSVALAGSERRLKVSLDAETIDASAKTLRIKISAPEGYLLNSLAPSELTLGTSNEQAFKPAKSEVSFSTDEMSVEVAVDATAGEGQAILTATGDVYYCKHEDNAVCLIDTVDLALPLTVKSGGASEAVLEYELPQ